ncbi:MAG: hypothetical protein K0R65_559 [Crocinitomicaceae bacterium]|jgi:hypothetical protein|nr:hypothetical protein [Crocinitomicaceae bacterium]
MKAQTHNLFIAVGIFAVAMGLLESSVVIYLRELYYPEGFNFPIKRIPYNVSVVEIWREAATIVMLIGVGYIAGKNVLERFAFLCYAFAIWDLFYYVFLYVFIAWPESIFTWDLLFLLPFPWVGPVWAPCLIALLMIVGSILAVRKKQREPEFRVKPFWWIVLILGALNCILAFMMDFFRIYDFSATLGELLSDPEKSAFIYHYVPQKFDLALFLLGFGMMLTTVIAQLLIHPKKQMSYEKK